MSTLQGVRILVAGRSQTLASKARMAVGLGARMVGLLGRSRLPEGEALVLPNCQAVHTWGMRFPIDVVFVDGTWGVVEVLKGLLPWRFSPWVLKARSVVELPAGAADRVGVMIGDRLILQPVVG